MLASLNYWAALPEIVILAAASAILLIDLFVPDERRYISYWLTQLTLLLAACITLTTLRMDSIKGRVPLRPSPTHRGRTRMTRPAASRPQVPP
jgi:NADH:ubiquinone oxidoreductase subunit 2 (subunit N)